MRAHTHGARARAHAQAHELTFALADITALLGVLGATMVSFAKVSPTAAYLLVPYLGWCVCAPCAPCACVCVIAVCMCVIAVCVCARRAPCVVCRVYAPCVVCHVCV